MATRRLALLGTSSGPWVSIAGLREPVAKVTGLPKGKQVYVFSTTGPDTTCAGQFRSCDCDGEFPVPAGNWLKVEADEPLKSLIVVIVDKAA